MSTALPKPEEKWRRKGCLGEWTILSISETTATLDNCASGVEVPLVEMVEGWERVEPFVACEACPHGCVFACRLRILRSLAEDAQYVAALRAIAEKYPDALARLWILDADCPRAAAQKEAPR